MFGRVRSSFQFVSKGFSSCSSGVKSRASATFASAWGMCQRNPYKTTIFIVGGRAVVEGGLAFTTTEDLTNRFDASPYLGVAIGTGFALLGSIPNTLLTKSVSTFAEVTNTEEKPRIPLRSRAARCTENVLNSLCYLYGLAAGANGGFLTYTLASRLFAAGLSLAGVTASTPVAIAAGFVALPVGVAMLANFRFCELNWLAKNANRMAATVDLGSPKHWGLTAQHWKAALVGAFSPAPYMATYLARAAFGVGVAGTFVAAIGAVATTGFIVTCLPSIFDASRLVACNRGTASASSARVNTPAAKGSAKKTALIGSSIFTGCLDAIGLQAAGYWHVTKQFWDFAGGYVSYPMASIGATINAVMSLGFGVYEGTKNLGQALDKRTARLSEEAGLLPPVAGRRESMFHRPTQNPVFIKDQPEEKNKYVVTVYGGASAE